MCKYANKRNVQAILNGHIFYMKFILLKLNFTYGSSYQIKKTLIHLGITDTLKHVNFQSTTISQRYFFFLEVAKAIPPHSHIF